MIMMSDVWLPPTEVSPVSPLQRSDLATHAEPLLVLSAARGRRTLHYLSLDLRLADLVTGGLVILSHFEPKHVLGSAHLPHLPRLGHCEGCEDEEDEDVGVAGHGVGVMCDVMFAKLPRDWQEYYLHTVTLQARQEGGGD